MCCVCVSTGNYGHTKIEHNNACVACQFLKFTHSKRADTCVYWHTSVKFKLSCTVYYVTWLWSNVITTFIIKYQHLATHQYLHVQLSNQISCISLQYTLPCTSCTLLINCWSSIQTFCPCSTYPIKYIVKASVTNT